VPTKVDSHLIQLASTVFDSLKIFSSASASASEDGHSWDFDYPVITIATPDATEMEKVRRFFGSMTDAVLQYGLGMDKPGAPDYARHAIGICLDCEQYEHPLRCLTEVGFNTFLCKDMVSVQADPGAHGQNLLDNIHC
jgi:hypothetical protein